MRKLLTGIYIESNYAGVTLGAIELEKGFVLIDAPLKSEDGKSWIAALDEINPDIPKLLVNMDSNPDRTLGSKALECKIISHFDTMSVFKQRSAIFKAQSVEGGYEWEMEGGLSGVRWKHPEQFLSGTLELLWGGKRIFLYSRPSSESGSLWVEIPDQRVVFVGDTVVIDQPPFLEKANISEWIKQLDLLLDKYQNYKIISSRGGLVNEEHIKHLRKFLLNVEKLMEKLGKKQAIPTATQKLVDKLLSHWKYPAKFKEFYTDRLRHGLATYYTRNIYSQTLDTEE